MSQPSEPSAPSEWAVKAALELLIRWPWARSHLVRPCDTERAIALALDAAREAGIAEGRRLEREDVVAWLEDEPETTTMCDGHRHADGRSCAVLRPLTTSEAANAIERGDHAAPKEEG